MPNMNNVPLFGVSSMAQSLAFYCDGLGYRVTNEWRPDGELRWCQIERDGSAIMLQVSSEPVHPGGWSLCIFCDDAVALYHEFLGKGVAVEEPFVGNALWVTSVVDPDGFHIDFESPTDTPEDTKLSELN